MSKQIFISYNKDNSEAVHRLYDDLRKRGINTWIDTQDIKPGWPKQQTIYQGIIDSDCFIACLSPSFIEDEFCRSQIFLARAYNLRILPIIIDQFSLESNPLKEFFDAGQKYQYAFRGIEEFYILDFSGYYPGAWGRGSYERNFEDLAEAVQPISKPSPLNEELTYISYSMASDKEFVEQLARDLELARASIWIDRFNIKIGDNWREEMYTGLRKAKHFIVCLSPSVATSENIKYEVLLAKIRGLPIYPVVSEQTYGDKELFSELEKALEGSAEMRFLNNYQWFLPNPNYQTLLEDLKQTLGLIETKKQPKNGIFISYRRADSQATTGRIREKLVERFGAETVFMDVDSIPPGEDFSQYYKDWLTKRAAVVLIMIGEKWISLKGSASDTDAQTRLFQETDHVRIETETALSMDDLRVIPVLIGQAKMPTRNRLPESLHSLTRLNACKVRYDPDFGADIQKLIASIESI